MTCLWNVEKQILSVVNEWFYGDPENYWSNSDLVKSWSVFEDREGIFRTDIIEISTKIMILRDIPAVEKEKIDKLPDVVKKFKRELSKRILQILKKNGFSYDGITESSKFIDPESKLYWYRFVRTGVGLKE